MLFICSFLVVLSLTMIQSHIEVWTLYSIAGHICSLQVIILLVKMIFMFTVVPRSTTAETKRTSTWQVNSTVATHHFSVTDKSGDCLCQNGGSCVSSLPNAPTLVCKCPRDFGGDLCEGELEIILCMSYGPTWV